MDEEKILKPGANRGNETVKQDGLVFTIME